MTTYTIIAYRPNGSDWCMNNCMGTSDSDIEILIRSEDLDYNYTVEQAFQEAAKFAAGYLIKNHDARGTRELSDYEITYLINGDDEGEGIVSLESRAKELFDEELAKRAEAERQAKAEADELKRQKKAAAEKRKEEVERAMLAELQQKYADS